MKVFATLATILGVAYATPNTHIQHLSKMGSRSGLQQHNSVMHTSANTGMPNMKKSAPYHAQTDPNQYHLQDKFGNFEYAWKNQDSEKMEKGNDMSVRGRYAYIMSDGVLRRVDYIADNDGFHILQDNADNSRAQDRNKRSVEPDLIQTRMASFIDSTSLRKSPMISPNIYSVMGQDNNMVQRNMENEVSSKRNMYGMVDISSDLMDQDILGRNMMGNDMMGHNMMNENLMGHNLYSNDLSVDMMNRNMMDQDMLNHNMMDQEKIGHNLIGQDMSSNMLGNDRYANLMASVMSSNVMNRNMMGQDMLRGNMMGQDMLRGNMMGQDITSNMMGRKIASNMGNNRMNSYSSDIDRLPLGQHNTMSQRMEMIPQSRAANRLF